jgi:hypothetical protein
VPEAILHKLTHAEGLPREALKAASAHRAEMLPLFLNEIETHLALEPAARAIPTPLFFIFHLLGEWRERPAYRPLARLLRLPGHEIDTIFGDGITTTSHRVMAAVFDGDPEPLYDIILDPSAEEFIRAGICEALAILTLRGELDRDLKLTPSLLSMLERIEQHSGTLPMLAVTASGGQDGKLNKLRGAG